MDPGYSASNNNGASSQSGRAKSSQEVIDLTLDDNSSLDLTPDEIGVIIADNEADFVEKGSQDLLLEEDLLNQDIVVSIISNAKATPECADKRDASLNEERAAAKPMCHDTQHDKYNDDLALDRAISHSVSIQKDQAGNVFNKPPSDHSSYLQNLFTFLTQYATSDPMNLGLQPNKLELLYKSSHKQKLSSEWWVEMMKLPGVYYYQTEDGSLNGPNVVLSAKPFAPIDLEVFRGNLLQLCTAHEYFPLKILEPTKLKTLYICRYGRPVDVDYQGSGSWLDVLTDQPGILLHSTSRGSMVDTLVCCVGRLTYPVRPSLHFLPIFAQIVSLQLNELIVMLSKSSQALDMKTLRAMYLAQFKKPLKRLITHSTLFSYVGGVVMHDGAYKYILPIEINHTTNVVRSTTGPGNSPKLKRAQYLLARRQDLLKSLDLPVTENPSNATKDGIGAYVVGVLKLQSSPITCALFADKFDRMCGCSISAMLGEKWLSRLREFPGVLLRKVGPTKRSRNGLCAKTSLVWYDPSSVSLGWISSNKPAMHDTKTPASCELNKSIQHTLPTNNEGLGKEILNDDDRIHFKETQNKSEREGMSSKMVSTRELLQEKRTEQMDSEVLLDRTPTPIDTLTISTKAEVNVDMTALVEQVDQKNLEDVITCSPGLPHKVRDHRVPMFSPREQPSTLSKMDLCEVAVVLQKANCKVTAVRFAELYASLYDKSIRILLGDNWWMELLRMPGIYVQLASADNGAALSEEATRPADVILWHYDAQFGLIRTKLLLDAVPQESLQALAPYATSILKVLSKFAQSDAVNLGISSSQLATINEELNGVILRVVSPYWWQAMTKLLGVYFFLLDDEGEFVANNLYFSCKPFTPIPGEVFRSNLMKLCMPDAQSPLKILTPKRLAHMYREKYGRPVHVDCKNDDWTDVLVGQDGIIVYHQKSVISSNLHDKIICAAGKLTYPVYSQPVDAPKFTRHLCLQLNQLVGILSRSECPLSMEALDVAYYQNSTGMQLQPIVTQTSLLSYVEGVSVEVRIPTLVYAYHGMPIAIEPAADRSLTDLEGATEIPSCRYNPPTAVHKEPENNPVDDMLCWCNAIGNSQMNLSTKVLDDLKLMRAQYTEQQLQALQHLVSLTKPGEYISAAQLNDTMRALTGKGLKDVLGSSQDQKWWIRATTIPGVQFYFKEGDMHKSLNTMLTYTPETPKAVGTASSTVGLVSTTDSNPGKNEAAAMKFLGTELVEDDSSDFLSRPKAAPIISRSSSTSSSRDRVLARHTPAVIVTQAVDKAMIISGDTRLKRRLEDDPDQEDNKRARANIFMIAEYSGNSASSTPPASMPVENAQQPSSYNVASYVQLLKPSDSAAHRIELVQNIQKNLDLMTNVTDESLADILEAIGDYFGKKKQFEQANPRAPAADDTSVVHFVYEVTRHLKKVTGSLTEHTTSKLFMSIRKLPQPSCGKILEGLKVRLECSKSGPVFDPEAICDCFYHIKVFLYSPELKQTILLLGGKLQQWHSVCAEDKLTSLQYAKILLAFKEIPYVDEAISNLLTSINDLMGLPADLEDALADYRQWGSGAHISCGSTSLVELKYIGKGIIKMMNGAMQSSNNLMNQKFAATFRTYDPVLTDPLSTICAYMAVKLSALMRKEPDNKAVSADEDLTVYILQILRGQNSEDIRLRLLMDNLVQYARLLPVSSLKEKFCETTVIFIAHMENFSSDHRVVETLLVFFESILAQYRTLPIGESCATFDDKYLARSTKYLFSPPYMRNALRNLSSSSRIVMRFIVQLQPWLDDYPAARAGRGEKRWDLDDIGQAYLGFRRMREMPRLFEPVTNDTSAIASYQQAITFVNNFQRYALSTMSIPFGQYLVSGRFLKCISRCLMNLSESDEVFAFIVRELVDMLSRSEEELTTVNLLPLDAVADLMYVLGEKRGWTDVAGVVILSSLFNLTENISPQEVKTTVNIAQSDLSHYITMLTSLRGVVVVNQVVLNWFDMLLHFIFSAQVWDAHSTIMSFDQLFHSVSNICAGVSVLLQSHSRVATTCLQQLDLLFVKLSTKTTERNPYDLVMTSPLLALIQMSLWRVYVQRLSINSAAPCNGFFQFVSVSCAALIDTSIQTSSVTEWGHLISAGQVLADTLLLMSSKPEVAETLAGALLHILRIVFNYTGSVAEHAIDLAKDVLESSQAQISQLEQQPAENSTVDKQAILSALIDYAEEARIQSVIIGEEPGNREKPRRDVYILASYVLKCLADMCHHCNKPENASMPLQLQQVVILCLTLVLAYVDELQVTQLHQVLFFCRRFTKLQVYHSVALRRPVLYVLEACIRHAVTFLETSFWSLQNGLKAGEYQERGIVWSDRRVRREDAGRMRDFLRLVNEDTLALYFECMTIMGMIGKNMESKLLHEKKSLLMVHEHFFNGIIALPYRAFCVQFDFLDTLFGVPTITVTSKQEVFIHWKEVQDHAVRYLLRHLGSVEAVHHVVLHGVPCRLAWPVSSAAVRHRMQSLPATWQGAHRAECAQGEIYATCGGGDAIDSEGKVWFCVDIVPLTRCLPASLPRVCGWDDGKQLTKQLNVQYASLLVDTVCEAKPKALLRSVERLVDKFLAVLGLLDC